MFVFLMVAPLCSPGQTALVELANNKVTRTQICCGYIAQLRDRVKSSSSTQPICINAGLSGRTNLFQFDDLR
jgi:hypothetical protein